MRKASTFLFLLAFPLLATAADPGLAVDQARQLIATKRYIAAVDTLKGALADVEQMSPDDREKAAAAVHFYSAVALSGMNENANAAAHLRQFFELVPSARLSDPFKYEAQFVKLFRDTQPHAGNAPGSNEEAAFRFDTFYPDFAASVSSGAANQDPLMVWNAAMVILASRREKQQWEAVIPSADRTVFIDEFWKRRDPDPNTPENEFRETFTRRVAFADHAFGTPAERGSMGDRGKVFVLLGVPSSVRRRPLTPLDRVQILERTIVLNGSIEQWVYANTLLPFRIAKKYVGYRFVSQEGIGENVLQQEEPYAAQALLVAMNPNERRKKGE